MIKTSESIANIAKALASFQAEVKQPKKEGLNPHFRSKYVTLDDTVKTIHDIAPKFGLSYVQMPVADANGTGVITLIMHESGEFIESPPFMLPMDKKTPQGAGSAITYARRYSVSAAFGIVSDEDDDGNESSGLNNQNSNSNNKKNVASDKQLNLVKDLLNKKVTDKYDFTSLYTGLKERMNTTVDMENWTSSQASMAIKILQG